MDVPEKLLKIVQEKGVEWAAAALVEGSYGYYSPSTALLIVNDMLETKQLYGGAERTCACFKGNPVAELESDFKTFESLEKRDPDKAKHIVEMVKRNKSMSTIESWAFSAQYPTLI